MAHLHLSFLGPFQAELDGRLLTDFESNKVRALLVLLAVGATQPHSREALAELLWPEQPSGAALMNLRHILANLRHVLDDQRAWPPFLLVTAGTLQLNPEADVFVDHTRFLALTAPDATGGVDAWREAVALYRGPLLQGLCLDGSPDFEEWLAVLREQADRRMSRTLASLSAASAAQGDYAEAAGWTRQRIAIEPWNEEAHCQLMALLAVSGERSAALHQFSACAHVLAKQMDVQPMPETVALAERIRSGPIDPSLLDGLFGEALTLHRAQGPPPTTFRGPQQHSPFFGRQIELAQIAEALADPHCRLMTLVGPGGVGKTRLAMEAATRHAADFAHGAQFVPLASVQPGLVVAATLQALQAAQAGGANLKQQLLAFLTQREILLVLDNFEHLAGEAGLLVELLESAPHLKLLVTSRARLNLAAEWLLPLDGLETPPDKDAQLTFAGYSGRAGEDSPNFERYSALQLFLHAVRRVQPAYSPNAGDGCAAVRICRLLDGIPLAIELAAGWVRVIGAPAAAARLEQSLDLLETTLRDVPPRHRSMRAVFDHSWSLLNEDEQRVLRRMAVFHGPFTAEAAQAVAGASLADLAGLVDKCWLRPHADGHFDLHELARQYAEEQLAAYPTAQNGEAIDDVRRRHCAYYSGLLYERVGKRLLHHARPGDIMADFENLLAAWQWALTHGEWAAAEHMTLAFYHVGEMLGSFRLIIHLFEHALDLLEPMVSAANPDREQRQAAGKVAHWLHYVRTEQLQYLGLLDQAGREYERDLAQIHDLPPYGSRAEQLLTASNAGAWIAFSRGDYGQARRMFRVMARRLRAAPFEHTLYSPEYGTIFWQAHAEAALARCAWVDGRYGVAQQRMRRALALREQIGELRYRGQNLGWYAEMLLTTGDLAEADEAAGEALRLGESFNDLMGVARAHLSLGHIKAAADRHAAAHVHFDQSESIARRSGSLTMVMESLTGHGRAELALGHADAAQALFEEALSALAAVGVVHCNAAAGATLGLGWAALAHNDLPAATAYFEQVPRMTGCTAWERMDARAGLAETHLAAGRAGEAAQLLDQVLRSPATAYGTRLRAENDLADMLHADIPQALTGQN